MSPQQWDDERLLAELREALQYVGAVPQSVRESVVEAGQAAWTWRTIDEELALASLVFDSLADAGPLVRSAAPAAPRLLLLEADGLSVHLEVDGRSVLGQLVPGGPGTVTVRTAEGVHAVVEADDLGCFSVDLPDVPVRLHCETEAGGLVTEWLRL